MLLLLFCLRFHNLNSDACNAATWFDWICNFLSYLWIRMSLVWVSGLDRSSGSECVWIMSQASSSEPYSGSTKWDPIQSILIGSKAEVREVKCERHVDRMGFKLQCFAPCIITKRAKSTDTSKPLPRHRHRHRHKRTREASLKLINCSRQSCCSDHWHSNGFGGDWVSVAFVWLPCREHLKYQASMKSNCIFHSFIML